MFHNFRNGTHYYAPFCLAHTIMLHSNFNNSCHLVMSMTIIILHTNSPDDITNISLVISMTSSYSGATCHYLYILHNFLTHQCTNMVCERCYRKKFFTNLVQSVRNAVLACILWAIIASIKNVIKYEITWTHLLRMSCQVVLLCALSKGEIRQMWYWKMFKLYLDESR